MKNLEAELNFDVLGALEGTDKSSSIAFSWDYLRHYQKLLDQWRQETINLIEIGVSVGHSLSVWRTYFPRATIIGIDIDPRCRRLAGDRVIVETGSQADPNFLHNIAAQFPPTIVIDDGSHLAHHIVYPFHRLFPALEPGGLYIIEDVELHFGEGASKWEGDRTVVVPEYFLNIARARTGNVQSNNNQCGDERYICKNVDPVTFIKGAIAIRKKGVRDLSKVVAYTESYLNIIEPSPSKYIRLAGYILRYNGPLDHAYDAAITALRLSDRDCSSLLLLADILERQKKFLEAATALREALQLRGDDAAIWHRLARIERRSGRITEAVQALTNAAALRPANAADIENELSHLIQASGDRQVAIAAATSAAALATG